VRCRCISDVNHKSGGARKAEEKERRRVGTTSSKTRVEDVCEGKRKEKSQGEESTAEKRREREKEREGRGGRETESREIERVQSAFTIGL